MKKFIINENQLNIVVSIFAEMKLKECISAFDMLRTLPEHIETLSSDEIKPDIPEA